MAKINNAQVIQKLIDELQLYPGTDLIPTELAEKILPVFQINDQNVNVTLDENLRIVTDDTINSNDKSFTVPTGKIWILKRFWITWTSTATVGDRKHRYDLVAPDGSIIHRSQGDVAFGTASSTRLVLSTEAFTDELMDNGMVQSFVGVQAYIHSPKNISLPAGSIINFKDQSNIDSADDFTFSIQVDEQDE